MKAGVTGSAILSSTTVSLALTLHLFWSRWPACGGDPTPVLPRSAHHILPWPRHTSTAPPRLLETRADCVCQDENPFSSLLINYEKLNNQVAGNREVQGEFTAPLVEATLPLEAMGPNMAGAGDTDSPSWSLGVMVRKATLPSTFWFPVPVLYLLGRQPW